MSVLPHHAQQRATRVPLRDTSAVLRFSDGRCKQGELKTVSFTGGLLSVPHSEQGSEFKLMFLTGAGPIMGNAEMLKPIGYNLQPFRFVSLHPSDQRKLGTMVLSSVKPKDSEQQWIEKYRAATNEGKLPRRGLKMFLGAATLVMISLAGVFYAYHAQLLK